MAIQTLNTIKTWFKTGLKPSQIQFWDTWDSFRHKYEKLPLKDVEDLESTLSTKAEKLELNEHTKNAGAHTELFSKKEDITNKGSANGYVPLNEFTKIATEYLNIVNDLTTGGTNSLLSAEQGVVLQAQIDSINQLLACDNINLNTIQKIAQAIGQVQISLNTILINDLTTGGVTKALTAEMGKLLQENKEDKSQKGLAGGYAPLDEFSKIAHQYLNIIDNLYDGGSTSILSAEQGLILQNQIDGINTLLFSDNINLDTIQEIVEAIETVASYLETILVNDLTTGGVTKALTAEMGKVLENTKLTATIGTDAETQISAAVPEDNKVVSRLKLFNWWQWIIGQVQTITAIWNFKRGILVNNSTGNYIYTTQILQDAVIVKLVSAEYGTYTANYSYGSFRFTFPNGLYNNIGTLTPTQNNSINYPNKSGVVALANDFVTTAPGTALTPAVIIPKGILTTIPQDGAIERDSNGSLWETHQGARDRFITTADGLILIAYKNNSFVDTPSNSISTNYSYSGSFDQIPIGTINNNNIYRINSLINIFYGNGYPVFGSIEPTKFSAELHMVPINCVFWDNGQVAVPSLKLAEYAGLNNNGYKNFQGFLIVESSSFVSVSSEVIVNDVKTSNTKSYVVWNAAKTALVPMSEASLKFELRLSAVYADPNNASGLNKNMSAQAKSYSLFIEIIK